MRSQLLSLSFIYAVLSLTLSTSGLNALAQSDTVSAPSVEELIRALQDKNNNSRSDTIRSLGALGDKAKSAVPLLVENLKDPDSYVRAAAANALGKIGTSAKSALPQLIALLKDPERFPRSDAAWAIRQVGDDKKSSVPQLIESVQKYENFAAARVLAEWGIEAVIPILKAAPKPEELCQSFCRLVDTLRKGVLKNLRADSYHGLVPNSSQITLDRLDALFVIKSTSICPAPENKDYLNSVLNQFLQAKTSNTVAALAEREDFSSLKIYGAQFKMQVLKELISQKDKLKLNTQQVQKLYDKLLAEAQTASKQFGSLGGVGGSAMTTYAQACHLIHMKAGTRVDCAPSREAYTQLKKAVEKDPIRLPYQLPASYADSPKASAARAVPSNLAIYLIDSITEQKAKNAKSLFLALKNYREHLGILASHAFFYPGAHNPDQESIAPYYFYSTIPYAMSALQLLENENALSKEEKKELDSISNKLNALLLGLLDQEKAQMLGQSPLMKDNGIYYSSPRYTTALGGLGLIPLLSKKCGEGKQSLGILSDVDTGGIQQFLGSDSKNPEKENEHR